MSGKKTHPERVIPPLARKAIEKTEKKPGNRTAIYSQYIILHFRATGNLAPGCDARDLMTWYEENMPRELEALTL